MVIDNWSLVHLSECETSLVLYYNFLLIMLGFSSPRSRGVYYCVLTVAVRLMA